MQIDTNSLALPWNTETDLPYGEQPRIYDANGSLVAVVGNAEIEKQDDWERNATAIVGAINATGKPAVAENATSKECLQVAADQIESAERLAGARVVTDEMVKAFQSKYREFWKGSWPDTETSRELLTAALAGRAER